MIGQLFVDLFPSSFKISKCNFKKRCNINYLMSDWSETHFDIFQTLSYSTVSNNLKLVVQGVGAKYIQTTPFYTNCQSRNTGNDTPKTILGQA